MMSKNQFSGLPEVFQNLFRIKTELYDVRGLEFSNFQRHKEGVAYGACSFLLNGKIVEYRVAKTTPKKVGQFVAIWQRNQAGVTVPFCYHDALDFLIITTKDKSNLGQFIFPKAVLAEKGIFSQNGKEGKRGIRVYPPWVVTTNKQAQKTQRWQTEYFMDVYGDRKTNLDGLKFF